MKTSRGHESRVWDLPLRLWHWSLAVCVAVSFYTGLFGGLESTSVHQFSGISVVALLVFRLTWGLWGGHYARWRHYITTPKRIVAFFRGSLVNLAHTPPGIALTVCLLVALGGQSISGLFVSDGVFFDGPFHRLVSDESAALARSLHTRLWTVIAALVGIHLLAHFVYGVILRTKIPLAMVTGRKPINVADTTYKGAWLFASIMTSAMVFGGLQFYSR